MSSPPPILLVDDDADDRELVALVLAGAFGEVEIEEASEATALARAVSAGRFGVVLTEHELPWIRSGDLLRLIRDLRPECPVIVLTRQPIERVAAEILHLAPDGLVPKTSAGLAGLPRQIRSALVHAQRRSEEAAEGRAVLTHASAELDEMAYVVSHDLRQPLTQIVRYLDLLERDAGDELQPEPRGALEQARRSAGRLEEMVQGVLRLARIESRGEAFAPVELGEVLERALERLNAEIVELGARIEAGPLPEVMADEAQMEQLFQNLIENALKFHGDTPPRLDIDVRDEGDQWHLRFRDRGIGIDPKDAVRIFVLFQRLHTAGEIPGSGIGLAVCRRIVSRHGGRIWVESRPGRGATFHVTLPKRPPARRDGAEESTA